ncbi:MAG: glycosyltransferase family 2 protein [Candidatus Nanoarchaeia archaeon]|nr:glycosyltransferase family 2 protein [Candidatus Nanoarchaeia archaeon]
MEKKFSLVIPVAPERSAPILQSINELDYPKGNFEVIVIRGRNPSEQRNKAAEQSKFDTIVFLDDDAHIERDYLKKIEEFTKEHPEIDIAGGPQLTPEGEIGFAKISGYALSSLFGAWKVSNRYSGKKPILNADETMLTSANLFCKREVFDKVKFDINLFPGEDPKFISDAKKFGFKVAYSPDIRIYHKRRADANSLMKQIFLYGKTRPLKEKFIETLKMPFFLIPSLFILYLLFLLLFLIYPLQFFLKYKLLILTPLMAYVALIILFSIYESYKNKDYKAVFFLPIIYFIIHLSYGAGMIYGYLKKFF